MKRAISFAVIVVALGVASKASAQAPSSEASFNPFATFSLNRFTFNTLGFLQVEPTNPFSTLPPTGMTSPVAGSGGIEEEVPLAVVPRPPYRPPVRSPYRPPPRPPF